LAFPWVKVCSGKIINYYKCKVIIKRLNPARPKKYILLFHAVPPGAVAMHARDVATSILIKLARVDSWGIGAFYRIALAALGHMIAAACREHANTKGNSGYNDAVFHACIY